LSAAYLQHEQARLTAFREDVRAVCSGGIGIQFQITAFVSFSFNYFILFYFFWVGGDVATQSEKHGLNLFSLKGRLEPGCRVSVFHRPSKTFQKYECC
jgi:hypothetical protein